MNEETEFTPERSTRWVAGIVVGATCFYFLIFAEFALLELATPLLAEEPWRLRGLLLALAAGGVLGSLGAARRFNLFRWQQQLSWALRGCALGAALALAVPSWPGLLAAAGLSGLSLGALTVILATGLRPTIGTAKLGLVIGGGTGGAYALSNVPWVFAATAQNQTVMAALVVAGASILSPWLAPQEPSSLHQGSYRAGALLRWTGILLMLVWLDSAVFYVIQHQSDLQAATWQGAGHRLTNAAIHLGLAVVAGWWLDRGGRMGLVLVAFLALTAGALLLNSGLRGGAGWVYAAGVSVYSVVLVYYPARSGRAWVAAGVYIVAGWLGLALGIGMAQNLGEVPPAFLAVAGAVIGLLVLWQAGQGRAVAVVGLGLVGWVTSPEVAAGASRLGSLPEGRALHLAAGWIHDDPRYVRSGTADEYRWVKSTIHHSTPPCA